MAQHVVTGSLEALTALLGGKTEVTVVINNPGPIKRRMRRRRKTAEKA